MKFLDEFRDLRLAEVWADRIARRSKGRSFTFMEVCGTHTMSVHRYGIRGLLPDNVRLLSGPGCPVCVTPNVYLDTAIALSGLRGVTLATFGDMMRVPGSRSSLERERAEGRDIRVVYSALDAVRLASANPGLRVVFLGVGFETTAPTVAASILEAERLGLLNYFVLSSHKLMPPAMRALVEDPELSIDGFICPPHVSVIIGSEPYRFIAEDYGVPCVIAGFEPLDILQGIYMLVDQRADGRAEVEVQYSRAVTAVGNVRAREIMGRVFEPCDAEWRGLGVIPGSGLSLREGYLRFDPLSALGDVDVGEVREPKGCICGSVLRGAREPTDCPLFGTVCTPDSPVGACMVSSEGACAAYYRYGGESWADMET